ncbi:MAG: RDD family protein [Campylobacterota bacterium]|nr:RDD family protein [Campylobacterota bacterium]
MSRWRDVKQGKVSTEKKEKTKKTTSSKKEDADTIISASPLVRIKAFITDMFMLMMPIMYITTYIIMDGSQDFKSNDLSHWVTMGVFGTIVILFWIFKGQTPGFKAYDLHLIDDHTKRKVSAGIAIARYMMFIVSSIIIVGALLPFFRKDKKTLQDVILHTSVIRIEK